MYQADTILELKKKRSTKDKPFAYDEVRVIGASPVDHGPGTGWSGVDAQGVVLAPLTEFGSNIDEPLGKIQALYSVKELPEEEVIDTKIRVKSATTAQSGPTPEEVFAEEAPGKPSKDGKRGRTERSPLPEPEQTEGGSPLG